MATKAKKSRKVEEEVKKTKRAKTAEKAKATAKAKAAPAKATKSKTTTKAVKGKATKAKAKTTRKAKVVEAVELATTDATTSICLVKNPTKWKPFTGIWEAPSDFKPFWLRVTLTTDKDGMFSGITDAVRYVGAIEADKDPKKMLSLLEYDVPTVMRLNSRLGKAFFHSTGRPNARGISPRIPANTALDIHIRVSKKAADNSLTTSVSKVFAKVGRAAQVELGRTDPAFRKVRGISRHLPAAFAEVLALPSLSEINRIRKERAQDD